MMTSPLKCVDSEEIDFDGDLAFLMVIKVNILLKYINHDGRPISNMRMEIKNIQDNSTLGVKSASKSFLQIF